MTVGSAPVSVRLLEQNIRNFEISERSAWRRPVSMALVVGSFGSHVPRAPSRVAAL